MVYESAWISEAALGRAHDHDLYCVIMTVTTIKYTVAILPIVCSTKSHPSNALGVIDNVRIVRRSRIGVLIGLMS